MTFTRADLENYEKQPQKPVDDKLNPFRGATPARVADAAAVAAVAAGQVDATPGGTAAAAASDTLVDDDAPVVDEDGTLGDQTDSGEGTSDEDADPSTASADLSGEQDPNTDLTGEQDDAPARPAPKKGSAEERIVELNDLLEGTKIFGKHMQSQLKDALSELERLKNGGAPTASQSAAAVAAPVVEDEPMPDLADADIAFDNDKYRAKMQKWSKDQAKIAARELIREMSGADEAQRRRAAVETNIAEFSKTHKDFKAVVSENPVLALKENQLAPDAGVAVAQSGHVARLLYEFGKDTAMAIRTARQSPAQQLVTIGKMIAKIEAETASGSKQNNGSKPDAQQGKPKSITQAPPPPRTIPASGRAAGRDILDPNMSMEDFARQHRGSKQSAREQHRKMRGLN